VFKIIVKEDLTMANKMSRVEAGRRGAEALNRDPQKKSAAAHKAAITRKEREGEDAFQRMGARGGHARGGKTDQKEEA
jgi:hypothetical protein